VVGNYELFEATIHTKVDVCNLWERHGGMWVRQDATEGLLDVAGRWVCQVEWHMKEQGAVWGGGGFFVAAGMLGAILQASLK
jgi:hypothetical protein